MCSIVLAAMIVKQAESGLGKHTWDLTPRMASKSAMVRDKATQFITF